MKILRSATIIPPELYVERAADRQLEEIVKEMGRPGYVLVARQMGKTNLLLNMKRNRERAGDLVIYLDLSTRFETLRGLFRQVIDQLVESNAIIKSEFQGRVDYDRTKLSVEPNVEYDRHLRMIARAAQDIRIVLILDEIDSLTSSRYSNAFFAQIRSMYFARANHAEYARVTYVLSGVAEPADLIRDKSISPFNIGEKIYLEDFTEVEVNNFVGNAGLPFSLEVISEIFRWTRGNPRMTWDVCSELEDIGRAVTAGDVKDVVGKMYLGLFSRAPIDHIRNLVKEDVTVRRAVSAIRLGQSASLDQREKTALYLAGITADASNGRPTFRNPVIDLALDDSQLAKQPETRLVSYDLYLSYNREDNDAVELVAKLLRRRGLKVFDRKQQLSQGRSWSESLQNALADSSAIAIFVGPMGLNSVQYTELAFAIQQQQTDISFRLVPVWLNEARPDVSMLRRANWVDFREGDSPEAVDALINAARGAPEIDETRAMVSAELSRVNPYQGLMPFREETASLFFGREESTKIVINELSRRNLIAVVGSSGVGKSSLVHAGVVPALRTSPDGRVWTILSMTAGENSLYNLALSVSNLAEVTSDLIASNLTSSGLVLAQALESGAISLAQLVERIMLWVPGTDRVLLVIDQWEQIYSSSQSKQEIQKFIEMVVDATHSSPLSVILTLRSDFIQEALANRSLADALQGGIVNLSTMTHDELYRVIVEPARLLGYGFESGLPERMLRDLEQEGTMPLLQFSLAELWEERKGLNILRSSYEVIGRQHALEHRAERVFGSLNSYEQDAARNVMVQLVNAGDGEVFTRRRLVMSQIVPAGVIFVEKFLAEKLLVIDKGHIEFAHEAIIRSWPRLRSLIDENREILQQVAKLRVSASRWQTEGRNAALLLPSGRDLSDAVQLLRYYEKWATYPELLAFLDASINQEMTETTARRRRVARTRRITALAAAISALLSMAGTVVAFTSMKDFFSVVWRLITNVP